MKPGDPLAVEELFDSVSHRYDLLNDLLSIGLHRIWKREMLDFLSPATGQYWLDLCCGTGDLALDLARRVSPGGQVLGIDSAKGPLELARGRSKENPSLSITWLQQDALNTGLPPRLFDGAVMAYGLRNLSSPKAGLQEIHRLLKPGARAGVLDFSKKIEGSTGDRFQKFYLRRVVVPVAEIAGLKTQYSYLEASLKHFLSGSDQVQLALALGFRKACYHDFAAGQMGVLFLEV